MEKIASQIIAEKDLFGRVPFSDTEMKESEFEEEIYRPAVDEKLDDVVEKAESKKEETKVEEPTVDDDDLF